MTNWLVLRVVVGVVLGACGCNAWAVGVACAWEDVVARLEMVEGRTNAVCVDGSRAYVGRGFGFEVFDVSDPAHPVRLASIVESGTVYELAIDGAVLYTSWSSGVTMYDVSNPAVPVEMGTYSGVGFGGAVAARGGLGYFVDGQSGRLHVVDVSDPASPAFVSIAPGDDYLHLSVKDGCVFTVGEGEQARIIDVSNPLSPTVVGAPELLINTTPRGVAVAGDLACYADAWYGLTIVDVSDPTDPVRLATLELPGTARRVAVEGDRAYVSCEGGGVQVVDITDPQMPVRLGWYSLPGEARESAVFGEAVIAVSGTNEAWVIDTATVPGTSVIARRETEARHVAVNGTMAYVSGSDGFYVWDISDQASPRLLGTGVLDGRSRGIAAGGGYAFVCSDQGVMVWDVRSPREPFIAGRYVTQSPSHVSILGDVLMCDGAGGTLDLVDVSDPSRPVRVGLDDDVGEVLGIERDGDLVVVLSGRWGLLTFDVSDPANPVRLGQAASETGESLGLAGDRAFVEYAQGLEVFDLSDATAPVRTGRFLVPGGEGRVFVEGDRLCMLSREAVFSGGGSLRVFDVSDPDNPTLRGHAREWEFSLHMAFGDGLVVVAAETELVVLDISGCTGCAADLSGDGVLDGDDIDRFVMGFLSGDTALDFSGDGVLNFDDIDAFVALFLSGCPWE